MPHDRAAPTQTRSSWDVAKFHSVTKLRAWTLELLPYWYSVFTLFTERGQQSSMLTNTMSSPELAMHISTNMHDAQYRVPNKPKFNKHTNRQLINATAA